MSPAGPAPDSASSAVAHVAAAHLAFEDQPAGFAADIGGQHAVDKPAQRLQFGDRGIGGEGVAKQLHLAGAEAARLLRGPTRGVDRAVHEKHRQRDIVGDTLTPHIVEERKALALGIIEAIAHLVAAGVEDCERTVLELRRVRQVEVGGGDDDVFGSFPPDKAAAEYVGMQRLHEGADPM